jgi:hypothetical protein
VLSIDDALASATHLLGSRFGGTPELTHPENLGGSGDSLVIRVKVSPNPFLQERTVVIKQLPPVTAGENGRPSDADAEAIWGADPRGGGLPVHQHPRRGAPPRAAAARPRHRLPSSWCSPTAGDGRNYSDILATDDDTDRAAALRKLGRALGTHARRHRRRPGGLRHPQPPPALAAQPARLPGHRPGRRRRRPRRPGSGPAPTQRGHGIDPTVEEFAQEAGQRQSPLPVCRRSPRST